MLVLECLTIYALACMVFTAVVMVRSFNEVVDEVPSGTRSGVFVVGILFVVLTSPFWVPRVAMRIIRTLRQEIVKACQLSEEDHL